MTDRRILFHKLLCEILSCPIEGEQCRCYFQPPESIKMNYPAIVYSLDDVDKTYANDGVYLSNRRYAVTVIDSRPCVCNTSGFWGDGEFLVLRN